ncbi:DUF6629 family protein [Streptomyces sp. NPDC058157]|uniref:DUF6629 family protein n=1 Tax=Streptomyces sp. NPDC058157 TaxID=3346360 RepID=UPI0036E3E9EB
MCWSASADLAAGSAVAAVGVVCLARVRRARDLPVAALPLLLGAHQLVEAAVWDAGGGCGPATTAWVLAYCLAVRPVSAEVRGRVMGYAVDVPYAPLVLAGYLCATLGSLLLSGDRLLRVLGGVLGAGAAVCAALWRLEFASTWCAFAAVASLLVLGWVRRAVPATGSGRPGRRGGRRRRRRGVRRTGRRSAG